MKYLQNQPWISWSREERLFCAILYEHARKDPAGFAEWLIGQCWLDQIALASKWDIGFEVCFYRDYEWGMGSTAKTSGHSPKRTFDLCLFGENSILIIEAKCFMGFEKPQLNSIKDDAALIPSMLDHPVQVRTIALTSSKYKPRLSTRGYFHDKFIHWSDLAEKFDEPIFRTANRLYGSKPGSKREDHT